jgi:hypothetical protein
LWPEPELYTPLTEVDDWAWHVLVLPLVLEDGVSMREPEDLRDALCVEKVLRWDARRHDPDPTSIGGWFRPGLSVAYSYKIK